jgi:pyruvate kinase
MVDLRGPLIRTLAFENGDHSIRVKAGDIVRISTNQSLKGN